jgi:hypothetical protein
MEFNMIMALIVVVFTVVSMVLVPWLKKQKLWIGALFAVNIIEQICAFLELQGYGVKKYAFVRKVLIMLNPKLSEQQIEIIIETLVEKMNALKGA